MATLSNKYPYGTPYSGMFIPSGEGGGGNDSNTVLLLNCDGTDTSPDFADTSVGGSTHTVTANGNAQVDTAQKKFGTGALLLDGTGDYLSVPDSADWNFGSGDFTIDCWVRFNSLAVGNDAPFICGQYEDGDNYWYLEAQSGSNALEFRVQDTGTNTIAISGTWSSQTTATWYHVALSRSGSNFYMFIDGTLLSMTGTPDSSSVPDISGGLNIGVLTNSNYLNGWIDEFRISKGVARWTSSFTPPTEAYT